MQALHVFAVAALCVVAHAGYISHSGYGASSHGLAGLGGYGGGAGGHGGGAGGHGGGAGGYGGGAGGHGDGGHGHEDYYAYPKYNFDYSVKDPHTGDNKAQWETRDGDVVKGSYTVAEADGTTRIVEYTADKHNGFNAVVKRIGHAHHPQVYATHSDGGYSGYHH